MKNLKSSKNSLNGLIAALAMWLLTSAALVDPTRPPDNLIPAGNAPLVSGAPQLSAIFLSPTYRRAIINGNLVHIGEQVGAFTIINIQDDTVELKGSQDNSVILPILPTVKQATTVNKG